MNEKIHTINAGSRPAYEIIENSDKVSLTIRDAQHPERSITIMRSMVPTLIGILQPLAD